MRLPTRPWRSPALTTLGCVLLLVAGGALLWLPFHTQNALDDWAVDLRAHGVPARAQVHDLVTKRGGTSKTMHFRYAVDGRTYEREVACVEVCRSIGDEVPIWVNRTDPGDFVTDFGQLSGHRGRLQGGLGAAGFMLLVVAIPLTLSRLRLPSRLRRRTPPRRSAAPVPGGTVRIRHKRKRRR
ncbi:DUF3592 domain-containing protein [Micromonospora sp. WMMA1998]|uniref:DUF3592 domain-containing protein n=1 Tax=Micromonospora sp. WMMA1998 TaxID=3015167 RepID=UPI00248D0841|nr:DUF3592 domain-containing protein [Micromonospora sp. WMMA1998]WBC13004.1 DUF3592 domain-containing protein [Micromonospora sp. WMMA1998]